MTAKWLPVIHSMDTNPNFVHFEGRELDPTEEAKMKGWLLVNAMVLEIGSSFAGFRYHNS